MSGAVELRPPEPLLAVGGVARGPLHDEAAEVLVESCGGGKAAHAQGEQHPASGVGRLGGVLSELLADLAVDLISEDGRTRQGRRAYGSVCGERERHVH